MDLSVSELIYNAIIIRDSKYNFEEALELFRKALDIEPHNSTILSELAKTLLIMENKKEHSDDKSNYLFLRQLFLKAINLNKNNLVAWKGLADVLLILNDKDDAIKAYEKLIELEPKNPFHWLNIAWAVDDNNTDVQINCCQQALKLAQNDPIIITEIGKILESMFFVEKANQFYKTALIFEPSYEPAQEKISKLFLHENSSSQNSSYSKSSNQSNLFSLLEEIRKQIS